MSQSKEEKMAELNLVAIECGYESAEDQAQSLIAEQYPATQDIESAARRLINAAIREGDSIGRIAAIGSF